MGFIREARIADHHHSMLFRPISLIYNNAWKEGSRYLSYCVPDQAKRIVRHAVMELKSSDFGPKSVDILLKLGAL